MGRLVSWLGRAVRQGYGASLQRSKAAALILIAAPTLAWAEPVQIVALGDSLTAGYGLQRDKGFVPRLQAWLDARGAEAEVVNAGVSGDTTAGGLARAEWSLGDKADAMILALGGNDLLRGIDPAVTRENLRQILQIAEAKGVEVMLVGLQSSGNYGAAYKQEFDAIYPDLSEEFGTLYESNWFRALANDGQGMIDQKWMQGDGIHPNGRGVERIVEQLGPTVLDLVERAQADATTRAQAD
ncbi:arylesterase [Aquicoccus sp. SCR17]|nr:arylesterase [Carideicomes alvinocaridis]